MKDRQKGDKVTQIRGGQVISGRKKPVPKGPQKRHDWRAIERAYATGKYTQMQLGKRYGIANTTINKKIKADQAKDPTRWQQNLTRDVGDAAAALLLQAGVQRTVQSGKAAESIMAAAVAVRDVILEHRDDIKDARASSKDMLAELRTATLRKDELRRLLDMAVLEGLTPEEAAEARELLGRHTRLHTRIASLQKMTDAMAKLQTMERRAFNIPDEIEKPSDSPADTLTDEQLRAEIARLEGEMAATRPAEEPATEAPMLRTGT